MKYIFINSIDFILKAFKNKFSLFIFIFLDFFIIIVSLSKIYKYYESLLLSLLLSLGWNICAQRSKTVFLSISAASLSKFNKLNHQCWFSYNILQNHWFFQQICIFPFIFKSFLYSNKIKKLKYALKQRQESFLSLVLASKT